jgi:hypothetical protein
MELKTAGPTPTNYGISQARFYTRAGIINEEIMQMDFEQQAGHFKAILHAKNGM